MRKRDLIVLVSAFLSFILSVYLWFSGEKEMAVSSITSKPLVKQKALKQFLILSKQ
jgi:hypothetical protein